MLCTNCGVSNDAEHNFCMACGFRLEKEVAVPDPSPADSNREEAGINTADNSAGSFLERLPGRERLQAASQELFQKVKGMPLKLLAVTGAAVVLLALLVILLIPKANIVLEAMTVPEYVLAGDDFIVEVKVMNKGNGKGTYPLVLKIDEEEYLTREVVLEAGTEETVQFEIAGTFPAGVYWLDVVLPPGQGDMQLLGDVLRVLKPAEFQLSRFSVTPNPAHINEEGKISVYVSNLGEVEGSYTLSLTIDGKIEQTEEITLAGESSKTVSFNIVRDKPGNYSVGLDNLSELLRVWQITRPNNGAVLLNDVKGGYGHLRIKNDNERDCVIAMTSSSNPQKALLLVYVRGKSSHTVKGIKNGTYQIFYSFGEDWESHSQEFTKNFYHQKFQEEARYTLKYPQYNVISIGFGATGGDAAAVESVSKDQFPRREVHPGDS